jgi:MFS family permease
MPLYRAMWIAITASNVGTWMNEVGVTWMMASLGASNLMIALIQTASTLPFLLLAYPAGALADIFDRRRILLGLHLWMLGSAIVLTIITYRELSTEWWLLVLTLSLAAGNAMMRPAFSASVPAFVPREDLHKAVTLNSLSTNASKAIGPAIGGFIIAWAGPHVVFAINAGSFIFIFVVLLLRFPKRIGIPSQLPPQRFTQALKSGLVYTMHDPDLRSVLIRCMVFFAFASAFWSLMPALLIRNFNSSAQTYGAMMALTGIGSVIGAMCMPLLYKIWSRNRLFTFSSGLYGLGMMLMASAGELWAVCLTAILLGVAWITGFSVLIVTCQLAVPDWVRARALAIFMLAYGASATPSSAFWGHLADQLSITNSMAIAGLGALATVLLGRWLPLSNDNRDHTPTVSQRAIPENNIGYKDGPVTVTREYNITAQNRDEFRSLMEKVRAIRKRNGVLSWQLDEVSQGHYKETVVIENWLDYLRHRERMTVDDHRLEEQITLLNGGREPELTMNSVPIKSNELGVVLVGDAN